MDITKENIHDAKMLKGLVSYVSKSNIKKVLTDGAYDSKDNFRYLDKLKIRPAIKVRKNSSLEDNTDCMPRKLSIAEQFSNAKRWKKRQGYGYRWMAECIFFLKDSLVNMYHL